jgi:hypothetical protein
MALVVPDQGEVKLLEYIVNKSAPSDLVLHLYVDDVDLSVEDFTVSSFTESTAAGYASANLVGANWDVSTTEGITAAVYDTSIAFSFTEGDSVYGYYVTNSSSTLVLWAERFPGAPFNLPSGGGEISVRPQLQLN